VIPLDERAKDEQKPFLERLLGIEVREGDAWKRRMLIWNITPAPAATPSPTTTPSNQ
jgi:hypothetical protein